MDLTPFGRHKDKQAKNLLNREFHAETNGKK
jgi:hypothetical protein